jgi:6-phosphofructokinase
VREQIGLRCRVVRPDVLQRCSRAHVSALDRMLAALVGTSAVDVAFAGAPGQAVMIALRLVDERWTTQAVALADVGGERTVPDACRLDPRTMSGLLA